MVFKDPDDPGALMIYDWKRSKAISWTKSNQRGRFPLDHLDDVNGTHYSLQLNLYRTLLERNYGVRISRMRLVRLHPDAKDYELIDVSPMDMEMRDLILMRQHQVAIAAEQALQNQAAQRELAIAATETAVELPATDDGNGTAGTAACKCTQSVE
jgi:hypothetical protein